MTHYFSHNNGDFQESEILIMRKNYATNTKNDQLESFGFKSRLTLHDIDFMEDVEADIKIFTENQSNKRVLVFPPFNNFRRFLIHQLVESEFKDLKSFSIGDGEERRTVVCFEKDFKDPVTPPPPTKIVRETKFISDHSANDIETNSPQSAKRNKRVRTMPSVSIYRPPAARKLEQNANLASIQARETVGGPSPEKSKLKCTGDGKETGSLGGRKSETEGISVFRNAITSIRAQNKVPRCKNVESTNRKNESVESKSEEVIKVIGVQSRQRRPDMQVYVPKHRRSANASCNNSNNTNNVSSCDTKISICHELEEKSVKNSEPEVSGPEEEEEEEEEEVSPQNECSQKIEVDEVDESTEVGAQNLDSEHDSKIKEPEVTIEDIRNESSGLNNNSDLENSSQSCDISNPAVSKNGSASSSDSDKNWRVRVSDGENGNSNSYDKRSSSGLLNPDECDWESMFDDTGECLDPSLLEQLTNAVGEVTIEKPKSKYKKFKNKTLDSVGDEFPHVVEIYNFPPEFQIQDLMTVFSQFKNSGFEIKWVDDTHALGIFSSSAVVSQVLALYHPFVKTRLLKEGTALSKMKARRSAEFLLPYKPRPDTCPALARRLVTGALGVRLNTSREEREAERKLLTKAREKKRLEAKQKEDAWEGTFS